MSTRLTRGEGAAIGVVLSQHLQERVRAARRAGALGHVTPQEANVLIDALDIYADHIGRLLVSPERFTLADGDRAANDPPPDRKPEQTEAAL